MNEALILIDTSIWIESFDKRVKPKVKGEMERLILEGRAAITPLVRLELLSGAPNEIEFERLREDLEALPQLDLAPEVWSGAYRLSFRLRRGGFTLPTVDILLAAMALHYKCKLWHRDRHFDLIAKHVDLRLHQI